MHVSTVQKLGLLRRTIENRLKAFHTQEQATERHLDKQSWLNARVQCVKDYRRAKEGFQQRKTVILYAKVHQTGVHDMR